jgi:hypothetical protein
MLSTMHIDGMHEAWCKYRSGRYWISGMDSLTTERGDERASFSTHRGYIIFQKANTTLFFLAEPSLTKLTSLHYPTPLRCRFRVRPNNIRAQTSSYVVLRRTSNSFPQSSYAKAISFPSSSLCARKSLTKAIINTAQATSNTCLTFLCNHQQQKRGLSRMPAIV